MQQQGGREGHRGEEKVKRTVQDHNSVTLHKSAQGTSEFLPSTQSRERTASAPLPAVNTHIRGPLVSTYTGVRQRAIVDTPTHLSHPELLSMLGSVLYLDKAESKFLHTRQLQRQGQHT